MRPLDEYETPETDDEERSGYTYKMLLSHARNLERRLALCREVLKSISEAEDFSGGFIGAEHSQAAKEALEATKPK